MARLARIKKKFGRCIATQYQYKDQRKQKCHEATRVSALEQLDSWIHDLSIGKSNRCWWMTGIAGVGKTAIAMSTVQCLLDRQPLSSGQSNRVLSMECAPILYGQYFCNVKLDTSNHHCLFPTLAFQIAETSPAAAHIIDDALNKQASLGDEFSLQQAKEIFLKPLCHLAKASPGITLVIVIDGVDEFEPSSIYREVTSVLSRVAAELSTNARLLMLSRPEDQITKHISSHITRHDLATEKSFQDVREHLCRKLKELEVDLDGFPSTEQVDALAKAAAGHFGWANQALNWLSRELELISDDMLDSRIKVISREAGGNLDKLYEFILSRSLPEEHPKPLFFIIQLQKLLRCLTVLQEPQPIHVIHELTHPDGAFDTLKCLRRLSSIYAEDTEPITLNTLPKPHKSFFDFITERAPEEFRIETAKAHEELASSCFRIMNEQLHFNMGGFISPLLYNNEAPLKVAADISYACSSFAHHVNSSQRGFDNEIQDWAEHHFLFWLEVQVLLHRGDLGAATRILESFSQVTSPLIVIKYSIDHSGTG
jgi:hypothetical protein